MRWRKLCSWASSVAIAPVILYGCAPHPVTFDTTTATGSITGQPGWRGLVIAAPHGTSDPRTGDIAAALARRTGFGVVIATGFGLESDARERAGRRYEVNRPFEGVPGRPQAEEVATEGARQVYEAYERRVREVARGPLRFLAEVHGNNHRDAAGRIEIATVGVDRDEAFRLRALLEVIRDAHLRANRQAPRLEILVEPADTLRYAASGAKKNGILRLPERALHIELPRAARAEWRETYTAILADFLVQAAALAGGR
jgi:hypothetical protein